MLPPLRRPCLGSIHPGIRCAPIRVSKNSARKSSRDQPNLFTRVETAKDVIGFLLTMRSKICDRSFVGEVLRFARDDKLLFQICEQARMRFLIGKRFGALLALFHDELV
jgi:hypothetical protein